MSLIKILKGIRAHWKKSTFAAGALAYGISYANEKYEINELMRKYCEEAVKYGDITIDVLEPSKRIVVILNPAANKKSAEKTFQKYCEPILHLSGMLIDVVKTDSEGHARRYVENMEKLPDAILVAGGDGTLSETVTGLMRRSINEVKCPIGILPLGRTNSIAKKVHQLNSISSSNGVEEIRSLAETAMTVVRGKTQKKDVMKIQVLSTSDDDDEKSQTKEETDQTETTMKPIYAMGSIEWGAFRDVKSLRDKYWYVGPFREYVSTLFNAFNDKLTWNCKAKLIYTPPCSGCSNCYIKSLPPSSNQKYLSTGRWWSRFIPKFRSQPLGRGNLKNHQLEPDYSKITNENCSKSNSIELNPAEIVLSANDTNSIEKNDGISSRLKVYVDGPIESKFEFITDNWRRIKTNEFHSGNEKVEARTIELIPENLSSDDNEIYFSIDSEAFEVKPIKVVLMPKALELYTS